MGASCSEESAIVPYEGRQRLVSRSLEDWRQRRCEQNPEFCSFEHLARPLNVLREGIVARKDNEPVLLLGPVIGRVTDTAASFMLEVSEEIDVNISIVQVNGHRGPFDRHISYMGPAQDFPDQPALLSLELDRTFFLAKTAVCTAQRLRPGSPSTFQLQGLEPDMPYMVFISNIPEAEMKGPLRFRTLPLRVTHLRVVVLGDYAASNFGTMVVEDDLGSDPWMELKKNVEVEGEAHVALHVSRSFGAQILDQICDSLTEHQSFCEGPKQAKVREAREQLRESYRTTLGGHPVLRAVLAQMCSNICVFMPPLDLATLLKRVWDLEDQAKRGVDTSLLLGDLHQLLCLALEVYREYQRAMWDGSFHEALHNLLLGQGWLNAVAKCSEEDLEAPSLEYLVDAGEISDSVEEWHVHRYGLITIMVLDTKGNAMTAALTGTKSTSILSDKQWEAVEEVLADDVAQVLLLVCDMPLVLEELARPKASELNTEVNATLEDHGEGHVDGGPDLSRHRWTMSWDMAAGIWDQPLRPGEERGSVGNGSHGSWKSSERNLEAQAVDTLDTQLAQAVAELAASSKEMVVIQHEDLEDLAPKEVPEIPKAAPTAQEPAEPAEAQAPEVLPAEVAEREGVEELDDKEPPELAGEGPSVAGRSPLTWSESPQERERLLEKLFEWKKEFDREVILVNGADFSTTGVLRDTRLDISIPVVLAGVVEGHPGIMNWKLEGQALPGGRFTYSYEDPSSDRWGLPVLDLDLARENPVTVKTSMVTGRRRREDFRLPRNTRGY